MDGYSSGGESSWLSASGSAGPVAVGRHPLMAAGLLSKKDRSELRVCVWVGAPVTGSGSVGNRLMSMPEMVSRAMIKALSCSVVRDEGPTAMGVLRAAR